MDDLRGRFPVTARGVQATLAGPVVPVWLAPWPTGGHVLVVARDVRRTLGPLGAAFIVAPASPTIAILGADEADTNDEHVTVAARDLVRRAAAAETLHRPRPAVDGTRHRVAQLLATAGVLLLAFRPGIEFEYVVQVASGLWIVAAVPIMRAAWRRATGARARDQVDALRLAFGAETARRNDAALPRVIGGTHPALVALTARLDETTSLREAARHARALGLPGLAEAYDPDGRAEGQGPTWVPVIRPRRPSPSTRPPAIGDVSEPPDEDAPAATVPDATALVATAAPPLADPAPAEVPPTEPATSSAAVEAPPTEPATSSAAPEASPTTPAAAPAEAPPADPAPADPAAPEAGLTQDIPTAPEGSIAPTART